MEWALEIALIFLLAATLFHALRLERALGMLKRDRASLEELIEGFNSSTRQAEQGIDRLRSTAEGAGRQIARHIEIASGLKDDLMFLNERGGKLADRLDGQVRAARSAVPEPWSDRAPMAKNSMAEPENAEEAMPRLRSQAERDLLKALRVPR